MRLFKKIVASFSAVAMVAVLCFTVVSKAATTEDLANQARWQADQKAHVELVAKQVAAYNAERAANQARWLADQEAQRALFAKQQAAYAAEQVANQARWAQDQVNHNALFASQQAAYAAENAANQARWAADQKAHAALVAQQIANNAKETARIKLEIVTNYTELAKVNPSYTNMIASATADYAQALANANALQAVADSLK